MLVPQRTTRNPHTQVVGTSTGVIAAYDLPANSAPGGVGASGFGSGGGGGLCGGGAVAAAVAGRLRLGLDCGEASLTLRRRIVLGDSSAIRSLAWLGPNAGRLALAVTLLGQRCPPHTTYTPQTLTPLPPCPRRHCARPQAVHHSMCVCVCGRACARLCHPACVCVCVLVSLSVNVCLQRGGLR